VKRNIKQEQLLYWSLLFSSLQKSGPLRKCPTYEDWDFDRSHCKIITASRTTTIIAVLTKMHYFWRPRLWSQS